MRRLLVSLGLSLFLAACGQGEAMGPFSETRTPATLGPRFFAPEAWAWGFIQTGDKPVQRYGVASTWRAPRAIIILLPGYGESAEVWFETTRDLTARGYIVWTLERAGQGGSGRYTLPRDLGHVPDVEPDVANLKALVRVVIKPRPGMPVILLGHGDGGLVGLRAVQQGLKVDGLVVSSLQMPPKGLTPDAPKTLAGRIGFGQLPDAGWRPWTRTSADDLALGRTHDVWRGAVRQAWQLTNPDLRMSGPSLGWRTAQAKAGRAAERDAIQTRTAVLMLRPTVADAALCNQISGCQARALPGSGSAPHLESDRWRRVWLGEVLAFVADKVEAQRTRDVAPVHTQPSVSASERPAAGVPVTHAP